MMHNVINIVKPNDAYGYQGNQTKQCLMLSKKENQTMGNIITEIRSKDI